MKNEILVSVGILTYNQEKYIRQTIDSILAQITNFNFEIIIADDCSIDNTREIVEEYAKRFPQLIRLLPPEPNMGVLRNYRRALTECYGKYIAFCGGDDYWQDSLKLQKQFDFLEAHVDYGVVHTEIDYYFEEANLLIKNMRYNEKMYIPDGEVFEPLLLRSFSISAISAFVRKELICKYVNFDEFLRAKFIYEDYPTWVELSRHTKFKYLPESTSTYRVIGNSISRPNDIIKKFNFLEEKFKITRYFINKYQLRESIRLKAEVIYHKQLFELSFMSGNKEKAREAFFYLKEMSSVSFSMKRKMFLLNFKVFYKFFFSLKKIIFPKKNKMIF
jgi:glycosyltransferase involved in cell wall biosynthesis